jgi:hypothetical protein
MVKMRGHEYMKLFIFSFQNCNIFIRALICFILVPNGPSLDSSRWPRKNVLRCGPEKRMFKDVGHNIILQMFTNLILYKRGKVPSINPSLTINTVASLRGSSISWTPLRLMKWKSLVRILIPFLCRHVKNNNNNNNKKTINTSQTKIYI